MKFILIFLLLVIATFGLPKPSHGNDGRFNILYHYYERGQAEITIIKDEHTNVLCYVSERGYGGGISCLTEKEIKEGME